jgi:hypothetical protein
VGARIEFETIAKLRSAPMNTWQLIAQPAAAPTDGEACSRHFVGESTSDEDFVADQLLYLALLLFVFSKCELHVSGSYVVRERVPGQHERRHMIRVVNRVECRRNGTG